MKCLSSQLKLNKILVGLALVMGMGVSHTALANNWITTSNNNCKAHNPNPQPNETATWSGECKDGYVHGQGTLQWYKNGKPNGTYVGGYSEGRMHGKGVYAWKDGSKYDGEWKDDKRHGLGKLTLVKGNNGIASYGNNGEWQGNAYVAQGQFYNGYFNQKMNNEQYAKALKEQKAEAKWTLTETYQCKVRNSYSNHTAKWSGGCRDGYVEGYGTLHWYKDDKLTGTYVGSFSKGNMQGKGVYVWADGSKYDGEYKESWQNGLGKLTLVRGSSAIGSYKLGEWQGDTYIVQGEFVNGKHTLQCEPNQKACDLARAEQERQAREREYREAEQRAIRNERACKNLYVGQVVYRQTNSFLFGKVTEEYIVSGIGASEVTVKKTYDGSHYRFECSVFQ